MKKIMWLAIFTLTLSMWGGSIQAAQTSSSTPPPASALTEQELQTLINLFEDPQKRDDFLNGLKALQKAQSSAVQETPPAKKIETSIPGIEIIFNELDDLSNSLDHAGGVIKYLIIGLPKTLDETGDALGDKETRRNLWKAFAALFIPLFLAWLFSTLLKRFIPATPDERPKLLRRLWLALIHVLAATAPYCAFLIIAAGLAQFLRIDILARDLITLLAMVLLIYNFILHICKASLSPDVYNLRLVSLKDEDANYLYIWLVRFGKLSVIYFLAVEGLRIAGLEHGTHLVIRGALLLIFPLLLTAFILQLRREANLRINKRLSELKTEQGLESESNSPDEPEMSPGEKPVERRPAWDATLRGRFVYFILRIWWLPAVIYVWAIFILLIVRHKSGFSYLISSTWGTLGVIIGFFLVFSLNNAAFRRLFTVSERVQTKLPGLKEKANRYLHLTEAASQALVGFLGLFFLAQVWGLPVLEAATSPIGSLIITRSAAIALTVGCVILIMEISRLAMTGLLEVKNGVEPSQKRKTFVPLLRTALVTASYFIGAVVILEQLGVNVAPILAGAGIVGLGVGLGAQSLVKDLINGLFILVMDMINVGDWVQLGDKSGLVEFIGLRAVTIRDLHGSVHIIPNSTIETVTNMTKGFSRYVMDVGVAYREDVDEVMNILREIGREMQVDPVFGPDIIEPLEVLGLNEFGDSAIIIRARVTTKPMKQWTIGREFNRRIKKIFDLRGIEIPFPHQTIYMGEPKQGNAPPLHVRINRISEAESVLDAGDNAMDSTRNNGAPTDPFLEKN